MSAITFGAAILLAVPAAANAGSTTTCDGTLAPGTYHTVVVPENASCTSDGFVTIRGGLFVEPGATLVLGSEENAVPTANITGGVHATDPLNLQIHFSTISDGIDSHGGS